MVCMKCGKDTKGEQVFCASCLAVMENYPVRRDVHIQLPNRTGAAPARKKKRRPHSGDEQLVRLRSYARTMTALAVILGMLLVATGAVLLYTVTDKGDASSNLGTNYTYNENAE